MLVEETTIILYRVLTWRAVSILHRGGKVEVRISREAHRKCAPHTQQMPQHDRCRISKVATKRNHHISTAQAPEDGTKQNRARHYKLWIVHNIGTNPNLIKAVSSKIHCAPISWRRSFFLIPNIYGTFLFRKAPLRYFFDFGFLVDCFKAARVIGFQIYPNPLEKNTNSARRVTSLFIYPILTYFSCSL